MLRKLLFITILLAVLLGQSCYLSSSARLEGSWYPLEPDVHVIAGFEISKDSVFLEDKFGMKYQGQVASSDPDLYVDLADGRRDTFHYRFQDSLLILNDSLAFTPSPYAIEQQHHKAISLLQMAAEVPLPVLSTEERLLPIKIRARSHKFPLLLGENQKCKLGDLAGYASRTICSGGRPKIRPPVTPLIFLDKEAELADLLWVEQYLLRFERQSRFYILTGQEGVGVHRFLTDNRIYFTEEESCLEEQIANYHRRSNLSLAPPPPSPPGNTKERFLEYQQASSLSTHNSADLQAKLSGHSGNMLLQIATDIPLEAYLEILAVVDTYRTQGQGRVWVHVLASSDC